MLTFLVRTCCDWYDNRIMSSTPFLLRVSVRGRVFFMCLKDLRDEFLYDCECRHLAKGSLRNYRAATRFLVDFLELRRITELEEVKPHHIRDLMKEKQDMGSTPRYINDLLKVWRTWFNYLVTEGYLDERDNPAKKVKPLRQPKTIIDTFTVDEMRRMIRFYDGTDFLSVRNKTIIMLLFDTGMRCNEMILMEPEDIKPDYILVKQVARNVWCQSRLRCPSN